MFRELLLRFVFSCVIRLKNLRNKFILTFRRVVQICKDWCRQAGLRRWFCCDGQGWIWIRPGSGFGIGVPGRQRAGLIEWARSLLTKRPVLMEPETKWPTLNGPTTFSVLIQWRALLMVQPHWEQSGVPPKTQGSTRLLRSAE